MNGAEAPIGVMVVDDSAVIRGLVGRILEAEPDLRVVASVANGRAAVEMLRHRRPDVVLLDVDMPEMDGLTALPLLLSASPGLPVIMNSSLTQHGAEVTMRALALGAADFVPKPSALSPVSGISAIAAELLAKVRAYAPARTGGAAPRTCAPTCAPAAGGGPPVRPGPDAGRIPGATTMPEPPRLLAIASSTGGPNALSELLRAMPRDFPLPTLIVQHMPPLFTAALAERLERESGRPCSEAADGDTLRAGHTYIAPGDFHLTLSAAGPDLVLHLDRSEPVNYCRPAADRTFRSLADAVGGAVLAVVLTGMGEDGVRGCEELVRRGARVLVQDEATSVVWGMPGAVYRAGLASAALPLPRLGRRIQELCCQPVGR